MKNSAVNLWRTAAGFVAGFAAVWLWPVHEAVKAKPAASRPSAFAGAVSGIDPRSSLARQLAAHRRAAALTPSQARDLVLALPYPVPEDEADWWEEVVRCWAEEEPEAAAAWIQEFSRHGSVDDALCMAALKPLARKDLAAALTVARRCLPNRWTAQRELPAALAERDPQAAMAFLERDSRYLQDFGAKAFGVWLHSDPSAACAWLSANPSRSNFLASVVPDLAEFAPDRLSSLLAGLPKEGEARKGATGGLSWVEFQHDPATALNKFEALGKDDRQPMLQALAWHAVRFAEPAKATRALAMLDPDERASILFTMTSVASGMEPEPVFRFLKTEGLTAQERNSILAQCATLGPEFAEPLVAAAKGGSEFDTRYGIANFWRCNLMEHPAETLPVLTKMIQSGEMNSTMLLSVIPGLSAQDNERWMAALPEEQKAAPRAWMALQKALTDPAADLTAFTDLNRPGAASDVMARFFEFEAGSHEQLRDLIPRLPASLQVEALGLFNVMGEDVKPLMPVMEKMLASTPPDSPGLTDAIQKVTRLLPGGNGEAIQWLNSLPPGPAVDAARPWAFGSWVSENEAAASTWLDSQPAGLPGRDEMVRWLINTVSPHDPASAWSWAQSAPDPEERQRLMKGVMTKWQALDPAAAAAAESALPP